MSTDPVKPLTETELDSLWTVYEGHSLVIERPAGDDIDDYAHVVMSISYDADEQVLAEVVELPLATVISLVERGYLERSTDGPVLDANSWFDDELERQVDAEEYVLSDAGLSAIEAAGGGLDGWSHDLDDRDAELE